MIVYSYGFKPRFEDRKPISDELFKANRYRNKLVELERERRGVFRELRSEIAPELAALETELGELQEKLDAVRKQHAAVPKAERRKHPLSERARDLREKRRELSARIKQARAAAQEPFAVGDAELKRRLEVIGATSPHAKREARLSTVADMLEEEFPEAWKRKIRSDLDTDIASKLARKGCGLGVGTYLAIEDAFLRSVKTSKLDPRFSRFQGGGKLGHQLKGELTPATVTLTPMEDDQSKRKHRYRARINIGKVSDPRWIEGRLTLHRPIPPGVAIKWAYLVAKRVGMKTRYTLQLTLDSDSQEQPGTSGAVAVNIGWRSLKSGEVRVGYAVGTGGSSRAIVLPEKMRKQVTFTRGVHAAADEHFNAMKRDWLPAAKAWKGAPDDFAEAVKTAHSWRAHARFAALSLRHRELEPDIWRLWSRWKSERLRAGLDLFASFGETISWAETAGAANPLLVYLEWWRIKDAHLMQCVLSTRRRVSVWLKELYQTEAKRLAGEAATVVLAKQTFTREAPAVEDDGRDKQEENAGKIAHWVSPGELYARISKHQNTVTMSTKGITTRHYNCGGTALEDPKKKIVLTCDRCGAQFDQDRNAALNLLETFERSGDDKNPEPARDDNQPESQKKGTGPTDGATKASAA